MPVAIKSTGGGSVTVQAPNTASDYTTTLPANNGTILTDGATITVAQGGTGLTSSGTNGNILISNGSSFTSTSNFTTGYTFTAYSIATGSFTVTPANGNYQYVTNNGAYTITAPTSDCAVDILVTNGASAGSTTFSGFTVGSSTGSALTTTNTNKFLISVRRINGTSTYSIYALQ